MYQITETESACGVTENTLRVLHSLTIDRGDTLIMPIQTSPAMAACLARNVLGESARFAMFGGYPGYTTARD